jgi:hypothetical protein
MHTKLNKLQIGVDMLKINLINDDFTDCAINSLHKKCRLRKRGNTLKSYINFIIKKNASYTQMIFLDVTQALVLNAVIHDITYSIKLLNATYKKERALCENATKKAEITQEQLECVSAADNQLAHFKRKVPMHKVSSNLGIEDFLINDEHVAANQVRIDALHQDMNDLCAVFALYNIGPTTCESVCNYCGIKNVSDMQKFNMITFSQYAQEYDPPKFFVLRKNITDMIQGLCCTKFNFKMFYKEHPKCRPVQVNEMSRFEWQPYCSPESLGTV